MTEELSSREIAIGVWLLIGLAPALFSKGIRKSALGLAKAFLGGKISMFVCAMLLYTAAVVVVLYFLGIWEMALLKDTIFWFTFSGFALAFRVATSRDSDKLVRKAFRDALRVTVVLEFLTNAYTLSLVGELLLVPVLIFLGLVDAVAGADEKNASFARLSGTLLAAGGLALIGFAVASALGDPQLWTLKSLKLLLIAPVLTLSFLPFLYLTALSLAYDRLNSLLIPALHGKSTVIRYARRRIRTFCRLHLRRVRLLLRDNKQQLMLIRNREDVDRLFADLVGR